MENFDLIAQALDADSPASLAPRLRRGVAVYLNSANLPRSPDDIEDIYGAFCVRALEKAEQYNPQRPLEGWLMLTAHNVVREAKYKSKDLEIPVSQIADQEQQRAQSQLELFDRLRADATRQRVDDHLRPLELPMPKLETLLPALSPGARELLHLSITEGWEIDRIAIHLHKSRAAVDTGLCRARAALAQAHQKWRREAQASEGVPPSQNTATAARRIGGAISQ